MKNRFLTGLFTLTITSTLTTNAQSACLTFEEYGEFQDVLSHADYRDDNYEGIHADFIRLHQSSLVSIRGSENSGFCSGTYIDNNMVLTSAHCIREMDAEAGDMFVQFNYRINPVTNNDDDFLDRYQIVEVVEGNRDSDTVVFRLEDGPQKLYPPARLNDRKLTLGENILSINHSGGRPQGFDFGPLSNASGYDFQIDELYVAGGASGSSALDSNGFVVGQINYTACAGTRGFSGGSKIEDMGLAAVIEVLNQYKEEESYGYANNFHDGIKWANIREVAWKLNSGKTPSLGTGPSNAIGNYLYFETSNGFANSHGNTAAIVSHPFELNESRFTFDYHMYGRDTGSLSVWVSDDNGKHWRQVFELNGPQQGRENSPWKTATLSSELGNDGDIVRIMIKAEAKGGYRGDIAIDNLRIDKIDTHSELTVRSVRYDPITNRSDWELVNGAIEYEHKIEGYDEVMLMHVTDIFRPKGKVKWVRACYSENECGPRTYLERHIH